MFKLKRESFYLLLFLSCICPFKSFSMEFFKTQIDYWGEGRTNSAPKSSNISEQRQTIVTQNTPSESKSIIRQQDGKKFSWENYIGDEALKNPEFWDDGGDYVPPRPFRELAANPSAENAKNFLSWMYQKNAATDAVSKALKNASNAKTLASSNDEPYTTSQLTPPQKPTEFEENKSFSAAVPMQPSVIAPSAFVAAAHKKIPWEQVHIIYFYESECPHCKKEKPIIERFVALGATITPVQIDFGVNAPLFVGSIPFDARLKKDFEITSVPSLYVKFNNRVTVFRGETSFSDIYNSLL